MSRDHMAQFREESASRERTSLPDSASMARIRRGTAEQFANVVNDESESIRDGGMGQLGRGMQLTAIVTTGLLYVIGALAMLIYAVRLRLYSTP